MKFLCTMLAFLVLILSAQPACVAATVVTSSCCSDSDCHEEAAEGNECNTNDDAEHGCTKGCNPFQVCSCCAFSVVVPSFIPLLSADSIPAPPINWGILFVQITEEPSSSCWQPPQFV